MSKPDLSVVVPVFNEENVLNEFYSRLKTVLQKLALKSEIIFVDDGSKDASAEILNDIKKSDPSVKILRFSRNFGHQIAIKAGIDHALGDAVVTIDADLQDPPEAIGEMIAEWRKGHDVVYAVRAKREGETLFKKLTAALYYRLLRSLSSVKLPLDTGDFRLMSREVADVIKSVNEKDPYIRGWVAWAASRPKPIQIQRQARFAGETKYSLFKMMRLAANGLLQFSFRRPGRHPRVHQDKPSRPIYTLRENNVP